MRTVLVIKIADENESQEKLRPIRKTSWTFWLFLAGALIVGLLWVLVLTPLPAIYFKSPIDVTTFQHNFFYLPVLLSVVYLAALIFQIYGKEMYREKLDAQKNPVILVDAHTQFDKIREIAKRDYGMQLGDCMRTSPLTPFKESGSIPTTRFFEFQNINYGQVVSHSLWYQNYVLKITTHLARRVFYGRDTPMKFWHGEARDEEHRGIADTTASRKQRELGNTKLNDDEEEYSGSLTEEE